MECVTLKLDCINVAEDVRKRGLINVYERNAIADWMEGRGFQEVTPEEFYREIFPKGSLDISKEAKTKNKGVGLVQTITKPLSERGIEHTSVGYPVTYYDDLDILKKEIDASWEKYSELELADMTDEVGVLVMSNGCSYFGREAKADNIFMMHAMITELDYINMDGDRPIELANLFKQLRSCYMESLGETREPLYPSPTFVVCSGRGVHLYYVFDDPIRVNKQYFPDHYKALEEYKYALMSSMWHRIIANKAVEIQSNAQRYRVVGTPTKTGSVCRAFRFGDLVSIDYMNSFCGVLRYLDETYRPVKAPELFRLPEQRQGASSGIQLKKRKWPKLGTMHPNAYANALARIRGFAVQGRRYWMLYCLAATARMCAIPFEQLKADAYGLLGFLDSLTETPDQKFTSYDIDCALKNYSYDGPFMSRERYERLCNINCPPPKCTKKNGRTRAEHVEYVNNLNRERREKRKAELGENYRAIEGRPLKWWPVFVYRCVYPDGSKTKCTKKAKASWDTVYKHWDVLEKFQQKDPDSFNAICNAVRKYGFDYSMNGGLKLTNGTPVHERAEERLKELGIL